MENVIVNFTQITDSNTRQYYCYDTPTWRNLGPRYHRL